MGPGVILGHFQHNLYEEGIIWLDSEENDANSAEKQVRQDIQTQGRQLLCLDPSPPDSRLFC